MFAVIATGGKQYKLAKDQIVRVEKLPAEVGAKVTLDQVLAVNDGKSLTLGAPVVAGASVVAEVLEQGKSDKVIIFKKKRRQNYRRKNGHRQMFTALKILDIKLGGAKKAAKAADEASA